MEFGHDSRWQSSTSAPCFSVFPCPVPVPLYWSICHLSVTQLQWVCRSDSFAGNTGPYKVCLDLLKILLIYFSAWPTTKRGSYNLSMHLYETSDVAPKIILYQQFQEFHISSTFSWTLVLTIFFWSTNTFRKSNMAHAGPFFLHDLWENHQMSSLNPMVSHRNTSATLIWVNFITTSLRPNPGISGIMVSRGVIPNGLDSG
jgi:hypothetical protein